MRTLFYTATLLLIYFLGAEYTGYSKPNHFFSVPFFHTLWLALTFLAIKVILKRQPTSAGTVFLVTMTLRFALFYALFQDLIPAAKSNLQHGFLFFGLLIGFLIVEVNMALTLINTDDNKTA